MNNLSLWVYDGGWQYLALISVLFIISGAVLKSVWNTSDLSNELSGKNRRREIAELKAHNKTAPIYLDDQSFGDPLDSSRFSSPQTLGISFDAQGNSASTMPTADIDTLVEAKSEERFRQLKNSFYGVEGESETGILDTSHDLSESSDIPVEQVSSAELSSAPVAGVDSEVLDNGDNAELADEGASKSEEVETPEETADSVTEDTIDEPSGMSDLTATEEIPEATSVIATESESPVVVESPVPEVPSYDESADDSESNTGALNDDEEDMSSETTALNDDDAQGAEDTIAVPLGITPLFLGSSISDEEHKVDNQSAVSDDESETTALNDESIEDAYESTETTDLKDENAD